VTAGRQIILVTTSHHVDLTCCHPLHGKMRVSFQAQ